MQIVRQILIFLVILIPLAAGLIGQPVPDPLSLTTQMRLLRQAQITSDLNGELTAAERILEFTPWRGDLWQRVGRIYLDTGQAERAVNALSQAASRNQLTAQGKIWLADALIRAGKTREAKELLITNPDRDPFVLMQTAALLRNTGDLENARKVIQFARESDPENAEINYQLAVLSIVGEPEQALELLRSIPENDRHFEVAEFLLRLIQSLDPNDPDVNWFVSIGQALSNIGEWDVALHAFQTATNLDPSFGFAWALTGEAEQRLGLDGEESLERALMLDPDGEMVNGLAGVYYHTIGDFNNAMVFLQKATAINPQAAVWKIEIGSVLADAGKLEDALLAYQAAIEIEESNPEVWEALAKFSLGHNYKVEEAGLQAARQAVLLSPDDPVCLDLLGTAYMILGDLDSAERFFEQALSLDPEEAAILIHLGQASLFRGDDQAAFDYWQRAYASARDERLKEMASRLLRENGAR